MIISWKTCQVPCQRARARALFSVQTNIVVRLARAAVLWRVQHAANARLVQLFVQSQRVLLLVLDPAIDVRLDLRLHKVAAAIAELNVRLVVVRRREALIPHGLGARSELVAKGLKCRVGFLGCLFF